MSIRKRRLAMKRIKPVVHVLTYWCKVGGEPWTQVTRIITRRP